MWYFQHDSHRGKNATLNCQEGPGWGSEPSPNICEALDSILSTTKTNPSETLHMDLTRVDRTRCLRSFSYVKTGAGQAQADGDSRGSHMGDSH